VRDSCLAQAPYSLFICLRRANVLMASVPPLRFFGVEVKLNLGWFAKPGFRR
jgi:hypothetical protein